MLLAFLELRDLPGILAENLFDELRQRPFVRDLCQPFFLHNLFWSLPTAIEFGEDFTGDFEADRPFGYRAFGPEYIRFDSPWLFEGAAGVALALLTTVSPKAPSWDRVMLLA